MIRKLSGMALKDGIGAEMVLKGAVIKKNVASGGGKEDHVRVELKNENGEMTALPILGKSGLISTLVKADGYIDIL